MDEKMRAEFEVAAKTAQGLDVTRLPNGVYRSFGTHQAWWAWQASRAALGIEMPPKLAQGDDYADGWNHALVLASGEIGIAGVRVKP